MTLQDNMIEAWSQRGVQASYVAGVAHDAPGLVKPETLHAALADMGRAISEIERWSA